MVVQTHISSSSFINVFLYKSPGAHAEPGVMLDCGQQITCILFLLFAFFLHMEGIMFVWLQYLFKHGMSRRMAS